MLEVVRINTQGQGLYEVSDQIQAVVENTGVESGLCNLFIQHTSASLTIQENADPSAKRDLESWIKREVPENHPDYTHTYEGPDDMPAHIKSVLTDVSLTLPVHGGRLMLGTWQGIYLWEHRSAAHSRKVLVSVLKSQ